MKYNIVIIIFCCSCLCFCGCGNRNSLEQNKLHSKIDKMEENTYLEKRSNPESMYQSINGFVYLLDGATLYKISVKDKKEDKIKAGVRSFLVTKNYIAYCDGEDTLHICDLNGNNDKKLYSNVDVCTTGEDENILLLSGHIDNWSLGEYDLNKNKFRQIDIKGNTSPKHTCFCDDMFVFADTYDISVVDIKTGEVKELLSLYGKKDAVAEVTCMYIFNKKIYYGIKALKNEYSSMTGLWRINLDGRNKEQLEKKEINNICFIGNQYIIFD